VPSVREAGLIQKERLRKRLSQKERLK
jgi:hypothetical protein